MFQTQVLRDTTRTGNRLYNTTENDRQICVVGGENGKVVELEEGTEQEEEEELVIRYESIPLQFVCRKASVCRKTCLTELFCFSQ